MPKPPSPKKLMKGVEPVPHVESMEQISRRVSELFLSGSLKSRNEYANSVLAWAAKNLDHAGFEQIRGAIMVMELIQCGLEWAETFPDKTAGAVVSYRTIQVASCPPKVVSHEPRIQKCS